MLAPPRPALPTDAQAAWDDHDTYGTWGDNAAEMAKYQALFGAHPPISAAMDYSSLHTDVRSGIWTALDAAVTNSNVVADLADPVTYPNRAALSVERFALTIDTSESSASSALTQGQVTANCLPFITSHVLAPDDSVEYLSSYHVDAYFSGSNIEVSRELASTSARVRVYVTVVEYDPDRVNVTQGTYTIADSSLSNTATISPALSDISNTFMVFHGTKAHSFDGWADYMTRGRITSTSQLTFDRGDSGGLIEGYWYTAESTAGDFSVQSYDVTLTTTTQNETINPAVDPGTTFTVGSWYTNQTVQPYRNDTSTIDVDLTNSTTLGFTRKNAGYSVLWSGFLVEMNDGTFVQRGTIAGQGATVSENVDVDYFSSNAMLILPGNMGGGSGGSFPGQTAADLVDAHVSLSYADSDTITVSHSTDGGEADNDISWELVQWSVPTTSCTLTRAEAIASYSAKVAHALVLEINNSVPWSLTGYSETLLRELLDPDELYSRWSLTTTPGTYTGLIIDHSPSRAYALSSPGALESIPTTINYFIETLATQFGHSSGEDPTFSIPMDDTMVESNEKVGASTLYISRTGCHFMVPFFNALARSVNIPAKEELSYYSVQAGHRTATCEVADVVLAHGDDPYNALLTAHPGIEKMDSYTYWAANILTLNVSTQRAELEQETGRLSGLKGASWLSQFIKDRFSNGSYGWDEVLHPTFYNFSRYLTTDELDTMYDDLVTVAGGTGLPHAGKIQVNVTPETATWTVYDSLSGEIYAGTGSTYVTNATYGDELVNLTPDDYTIEYDVHAGYTKPADAGPVTIGPYSHTFTGTYVPD